MSTGALPISTRNSLTSSVFRIIQRRESAASHRCNSDANFAFGRCSRLTIGSDILDGELVDKRRAKEDRHALGIGRHGARAGNRQPLIIGGAGLDSDLHGTTTDYCRWPGRPPKPSRSTVPVCSPAVNQNWARPPEVGEVAELPVSLGASIGGDHAAGGIAGSQSHTGAVGNCGTVGGPQANGNLGGIGAVRVSAQNSAD